MSQDKAVGITAGSFYSNSHLQPFCKRQKLSDSSGPRSEGALPGSPDPCARIAATRGLAPTSLSYPPGN